MAGSEQVVDLVGLAAGAAAERLVEIAKVQGYTVAATAPGTYRLARTRRRMLVDKRTESVVVTVFSDRTGTKARIVGEVDQVVVDRLRQMSGGVGRRSLAATARGSSPHAPAPPPPAAPPTTAPASAAPPGVAPPLAAPSMRPVTSTPAPPSMPTVGSPAPPQVSGGPAWWQPTPSPSNQPQDRTVARSSPRSASPAPMLVLPGGRSIPLDRPIVIGRHPDPSRGPDSATAVEIADPSISKTHAAVEVVDGVVWVTDLHSTNGTQVERHGSVAACAAAQPRRVDAGSTIVAGDVRLHVRGAR